MSITGERIPLRVSSNTAYLWNVDGMYRPPSRSFYLHFKIDIATLRSKYHICGILTGTLPHLSQQNVFLGIPLVLLPEEVVLLVENGIKLFVTSQNTEPCSRDSSHCK